VKLRFFAGLTTAQAAAALGISSTTAENGWVYARSCLSFLQVFTLTSLSRGTKARCDLFHCLFIVRCGS
jgi:hypothetical protein